MRTATMIAAAVAAGLVGAGAVVTPVVLAMNDDPEPVGAGPRWADDDARGPMGQGNGMAQMQGRGQGPGQGSPGQGHGMARGQVMGPGNGQGMRGDGDCTQLLEGVDKGTLSDAQQQTVAEQAELEKMTHDLYLVFAEETGDWRFERIAEAESRHLEAVRLLLDRYDVTDPTDGLAQGEFTSDAVQTMYDEYVEEGSESLEAALKVGADHERDDIAALEKFADDVDADDVERVFEHLVDGSEMHLAAFTR
ncbi:MAG TPA: DUF2202 domain-containing protein [Nocardioidaceae bacterium]